MGCLRRPGEVQCGHHECEVVEAGEAIEVRDTEIAALRAKLDEAMRRIESLSAMGKTHLGALMGAAATEASATSRLEVAERTLAAAQAQVESLYDWLGGDEAGPWPDLPLHELLRQVREIRKAFGVGAKSGEKTR